MKSILIFITLVVAVAITAGEDYCNMSCKDTDTGKIISHIACNHNHYFSRNCPNNAQLVPMTDTYKNNLINFHNEKRNFVAGGSLRGHGPACRMATMRWDIKLAYLAALNVVKCVDDHDKCHNTNEFHASGQNLALIWRTPAGPIDRFVYLNKSIHGWFKESQFSHQGIINRYPDYYSGPTIGHFTVMVKHDNTRLGCASCQYSKHGSTYLLTACNYATTNIKRKPIYEQCIQPGLKCHRINPQYPNLCSVDEVFHVNNFF